MFVIFFAFIWHWRRWDLSLHSWALHTTIKDNRRQKSFSQWSILWYHVRSRVSKSFLKVLDACIYCPLSHSLIFQSERNRIWSNLISKWIKELWIVVSSWTYEKWNEYYSVLSNLLFISMQLTYFCLFQILQLYLLRLVQS